MCDVMQVSFDACEWSYMLFWPQPGRSFSLADSNIWPKPISWGWIIVTEFSQTPEDAEPSVTRVRVERIAKRDH